jgi:nicotinamidase-related amidase
VAADGGSRWALLIVDFINRFDFPDSHKLEARALPAARRTAELKRRLRGQDVPCIYANDNFGHWRSEFSKLVKECLEAKGAAQEITAMLRPQAEDYSILKPRHSPFYGSPLEFLLEELEIDSLIVTGVSADMCISATAQDAYVRKFKLWVPSDCVAADTEAHERQALEHMQRTMKADIRPSGVGGLGWDEVRVG